MSDNSAQEDKKDIKKEPCQDATPHGFVADFKLMPHQESAFKWMVDREDQELPGGILGLEQGLGKTAIVIALILEQKNKNTMNGITGKSPTLIVVPKRVLYQWGAEFVSRLKKSALSVLLYYSDKSTKENPEEYDVVITTYNTVRIDKGSVLQDIKWTRIVLDEAHNIRNETTGKADAIAQLESKYRWCVTGKLIQNSKRDIDNVFTFLGGEILNEPISELLYNDNSIQLDKNLDEKTVETGALAGNEKIAYEILEKAHKKFSNKGNHFIMMNKVEQASIHFYNLRTDETQEATKNTFERAKKDFENAEAAFKKAEAAFKKATEIYQFSKTTLEDVGKLTEKFPEIFMKEYSNARINETIRIMKEILMKKEKVVVISEWIPVLEVVEYQISLWLETLIDEKEKKNFVRYIVDKTDAKDCHSIAEYLSDCEQMPSVILMSMRAGGCGLNLHGARNVILLGRHYNPALEDQAIRCVNNIAQKNKVTVYRIEISDTNEDNVKKAQEEKKAISEMARLSIGPSPLVKKEEE